MDNRRRPDPDGIEKGPEYRRKRRLADPAEGEARESDAELRGRQVGVEVAQHLLGGGRPPCPLPQQLLDAARPCFDDCELSCHEKGVEKYDENREDQRGSDAHMRRPGGAATGGLLMGRASIGGTINCIESLVEGARVRSGAYFEG